MALLPADEGIQRFKENEERVDDFVNALGTYLTRFNVPVETIRSFLARKEIELNGVLPSMNAINFNPGLPNTVVMTAEQKMKESRSIRDFGGVPHNSISDMTGAFDCSTAFQNAISSGEAIHIPRDGVYYCPGGFVAGDNVHMFGPGIVKGGGASGEFFNISGAATLWGIEFAGIKMTNDNQDSDFGLFCTGPGYTIAHCKIHDFAARGIELQVTGGVVANPGSIFANQIYKNGIGINTNDSEYQYIAMNRIYSNGLNNAKTNWSPVPGCGYGIIGKLSNTGVLSNIITDNAIGLYLNSGSTSNPGNPDHNVIIGNTINHNYAIGMALWNLWNWELVLGNVCLSNVTHAEAPLVVNPVTNTSNSLMLVDCLNLQFIGNTADCGTDTAKIPIYGHARCRYLGNNFFYAQPTEIRHPMAGTILHDNAGYTSNGDNLWSGNLFSGFERPVVLSSPWPTVIRDNLENGHLKDGAWFAPTMNANWNGQYAAYEPIRYCREGGNTVHLNGTIDNTGSGGAIAFNLPLGYRPANQVDALIINGTSGAVAWVRIYSNGDVQPVGGGANVPLSINLSFKCA